MTAVTQEGPNGSLSLAEVEAELGDVSQQMPVNPPFAAAPKEKQNAEVM